MDQAGRNNRANQLNPNNAAYHSSRGMNPPGTSSNGWRSSSGSSSSSSGSNSNSSSSSSSSSSDNGGGTDWIEVGMTVFSIANAIYKAYNSHCDKQEKEKQREQRY